ncbi:MAG: C45 family autoproteolytic acyltransferase/hydrolase [Verrucomicrobiales bacterium]|nr:C45 family autoproteolytic acyltransferase/hydrolase [Verrucomicrobiales bacterium]
MKKIRRFFITTGLLVLGWWFLILTTADSRRLATELREVYDLVLPDDAAAAMTLSGRIKVVQAEFLKGKLEGQQIDIRYRWPDRLRLSAKVDGSDYAVGRDGGEVWAWAGEKKFAVVGVNDVPRFAGVPDSVQPVELADFSLPLKSWHWWLAPAMLEVKSSEKGVRVRAKNWARQAFDLPAGELSLFFTEGGEIAGLQLEADGKVVKLEISELKIEEGAGSQSWKVPAPEGVKVERVALAHLKKFGEVLMANLENKIVPLTSESLGQRKVVAEFGKGRLESIDGTRVLFLQGSPEQMGEQHGKLLGAEARNLVDRIVYGVGVGSSIAKGRWFFGEIEEAQRRLEPFIPKAYLREMDALAVAAGLHPRETRLANFFPELFHCSGFALHGKATLGGRMYHGRVLDYLRGLGLEQNAVVMVMRPDDGNAWVNVGYAGFIGSVTAMNEKHLAIGEMGGRGEGDWDGKPMAQLMREVMEKADTIDQAVEIMRQSPRTCVYYYVISDAKSGRAVGIKATPDLFETVWSGEAHEQLSDPVEDTVLMSAGGRYKELVKRVKGQWGQFDEDSARDLMTRPVCMNSNIQSVLFAPGNLDFWVANADSKNVASATRYTKYNLAELLGRSKKVEGRK